MVISIITILASSLLFAMMEAQQQAKANRTRAQIAKIHTILIGKWERYRSRPLPLRLPNMAPNQLAATRLLALRETMRMELPDRITDVVDPPTLPLLSSPSTRNAYLRRSTTTWTPQFQSSECLYLILATTRDGETSALDYFRENEVGDLDNDGMREILDGWGNPILFLRWAPGFSSHPGPDGGWGNVNVDDDGDGIDDDAGEAGWPSSDDITISQIQSRNSEKSGDPMDPRRVDPRWRDANTSFDPFALYPLVFSAGEDKEYGIYVEDGYSPPDLRNVDNRTAPISGNPPLFRYSQTALPAPIGAWPSDPYAAAADYTQLDFALGTPFRFDIRTNSTSVTTLDSADNINNHLLEVRTD
ncbi:MAG: hypothetical protein QGG36_24795 [Pirellulaceae bacterium]|nr:hypothetical protein [Pirellulaceae bacterium]